MKKFLLSLIGIFLIVQGFATTRYLVAGGTGNWNSTTNWSLTSGGLSGAPFPTATEDVVIDANSSNANIAINVSSACLSIACSSYTGTFSGSAGFTVGGSITWSSGMNLTASGTLGIIGSGTLTSNGKVWQGAWSHVTAGLTFTLADDFSVMGNFTHTGGGTTLTLNGSGKAFNFKGNFTMSSGRIIAGTANIKCNGNTNQSISVTGSINNTQFEIASTGGTVTMQASLTLGGANFIYTSGTMDFTTNSNTIAVNASCTITMNGQSIFNLTTGTGSLTITLGSALTGTGTLSMQVSTTWAGSFGWTFNIQSSTLTARTYTLASGVTYVITTTMTNTIATSAAHNSFVSSSGGSQAILKLNPGATQDNSFINATDIDSSTGQTIWSYKGTLSNATNWNLIPSQPPVITTSN